MCASMLPVCDNEFSLMNDNKMAVKMAAACQFARVNTPTDFFQITYMDYFLQTLSQDRLLVLSDEQ